MDPVSALAFSCNILDLVERAFGCCRLFKELYKSTDGLAIGQHGIINAVDSMQAVIEGLAQTRLRVPMSRSEKGKVDQSLLLVASRCEDLAKELAATIEKCRVKKPGSILSVSKATLHTLLKKSDVEKMESDLQRWSQTLNTLLATCTHREVAFMLSQLKDAAVQRDGIVGKLERLEQMMGNATFLKGPFKDDSEVREQVREASDLAGEAQCAVNRQLILRSLRFLGTDMRMGEIHDAAEETFGWILEDAADTSLRDTENVQFANWLQQGLGIFHVTGKPGSGKSTLMKYITDHERTPVLLSQWAGTKKLVMSRFFLWRLGSREQKSFRGLTHGLLHDAIRSVPELTQFLFPQYWDPATYITQNAHGRLEFEITEKDLKTAFERLVGGLPEIVDRFCICFFIDGLDEFDEHQGVAYIEFCRHLRRYVSGSRDSLKMVVSSRPWPVFESLASSDTYKMSLHSLTRSDIYNLVNNTLNRNENFSKLGQTDPNGCQALVNRVVEDAEGVFLWVTLMLRSLEEGLSNHDSLTLLQDRVASTPQQLNEFFKTILDSIDVQYRRSAYYLFAIVMRMTGTLVHNANRPKVYLEFDATDNMTGNYHGSSPYISLLGSSFLFWAVDEKRRMDQSNVPARKQSDNEMEERIRRASVQIRGRCKGLLDVSHAHSVKFIHRTIPEYLQTYLSTRAPEYDLTDQGVGQVLLWTLLAEVKYLGVEGLVLLQGQQPPESRLLPETIRLNPLAAPYIPAQVPQNMVGDGDYVYLATMSPCLEPPPSTEIDELSPDELDDVHAFISLLETQLSQPHLEPGVFMYGGRMYHLLDWEAVPDESSSYYDSDDSEYDIDGLPLGMSRSGYKPGERVALDPERVFFEDAEMHDAGGYANPTDLDQLTHGNYLDQPQTGHPASYWYQTQPQDDLQWPPDSTELYGATHSRYEEPLNGHSPVPLTKKALMTLPVSVDVEDTDTFANEYSDIDTPAELSTADVNSLSVAVELDSLDIRSTEEFPHGDSAYELGSLLQHETPELVVREGYFYPSPFLYRRGRYEATDRVFQVTYTVRPNETSHPQNCTSAMTRHGYFLSRLRQVDLTGQEDTFKIIDCLDKEVYHSQWDTENPPDYLWAMVREPYFQEVQRRGASCIVNSRRDSFGIIGIASFLGLHEYISWRLDRMDEFDVNGFFASYLFANVMDGLICRPSHFGLRLLQSLLERGVSIDLDLSASWYQNQNADSGTVWHNYLFEVFYELRGAVTDTLSKDSMPVISDQHWLAVETCLEAGADPNFAVLVRRRQNGPSGETWSRPCVPYFAELLLPIPVSQQSSRSGQARSAMIRVGDDEHFIEDILRNRRSEQLMKKRYAQALGRTGWLFSSHISREKEVVRNAPLPSTLSNPEGGGSAAEKGEPEDKLDLSIHGFTDVMTSPQDFLVTLEDVVNHLKPSGKERLLLLMRKAAKARRGPLWKRIIVGLIRVVARVHATCQWLIASRQQIVKNGIGAMTRGCKKVWLLRAAWFRALGNVSLHVCIEILLVGIISILLARQSRPEY